MNKKQLKKRITELLESPDKDTLTILEQAEEYARLKRLAREQYEALTDKSKKNLIEEIWYIELKNILYKK